MKFKGQTNHYDHNTPPKIGVLLVNLGTPDAPTTPAVKRYLKEFLSDPRVVEIPKLIWWLILNGIILKIRPKKSAALYRSIWLTEGAPLLHYTQALTHKVTNCLKQSLPDASEHLIIECAMRYGNPSIGSVLQKMRDAGLHYLYVLPLYPQYSASTTASIFDAISNELKTWRLIPELFFLRNYHDNPRFIETCCKHIREHWAQHGKGEQLFLSYHGLPLRNLHLGDPYHCQCHKTTRLIREALGMDTHPIRTLFQSRFGRATWLQPYFDKTLEAEAKNGLESVQVFCPGFAVDCLETLEEIAVEGKASFLEAGGKSFHYIPALNDSDAHANTLVSLMEPVLQQWLQSIPTPSALSMQHQLAEQLPHNQAHKR